MGLGYTRRMKQHPVQRISELVSAAVVRAFGAEHAGADPAVHRSQFADFQADVAMRLAKGLKRAPIEVAKAIAAEIPANELCEDVRVSPPGFINFSLKRAALEEAVSALLADGRSGVACAPAPATVVIDYSGPNAAKEMHVGHLRGTVIGDSLARVLGFLGHTVIRQNHVGDWGTPFGMLVEHLLDIGSERAVSELAVGDFNTFYKAARGKFDEQPGFAERARQRVVLLQSGDAATLGLWHTLIDATRVYFRKVYDQLSVLLEDSDIRGESFYNPMLQDVVSDLERRGIAVRDQGALCVFLPEFKGKEGEPTPLIVQKQDGGFGYATTDLAAVRYRVSELHATRLLYVVGAPQAQHFAMVFATARKAGYLPESVSAEHVAFGSILGSDRKMLRTRAGESIRLSELLDEAVERALVKVREKSPQLSEEEQLAAARRVGVGAVKYADLSTERIKDYVFEWDRMLAFVGNTGPYLMYAHARSSTLFRKAADEHGIALARELLSGAPIAQASVSVNEPAERALVLELLELPSVVEAVAQSLQPHRLCAHLYELATKFMAFYDNCPVLKADSDELRDSRLLLCAATQRALGIGLGLLGMTAPARM